MTVRSALRAVAVALAVASLSMVSGCAALVGGPGSVELSSQQGWPDSAPAPPPSVDSYPTQPVGWVTQEGDRFWLVTWGSSSCPFIATAVAPIDDSTVAVGLEQMPAEACTDDLSPRAHELAVPESLVGSLTTAEVSLVESAFEPSSGGTPSSQWTVDLVGGWFATIADSFESGLADGIPPGDPEAFAPRVLVRDATVITLVTYGSSSCPALPTAAAVEVGVLAITVEPRPAEVCTADMAPTTSFFVAPAGFDSEAVTTARVTLVDRVAGESVETVPIETLD